MQIAPQVHDQVGGLHRIVYQLLFWVEQPGCLASETTRTSSRKFVFYLPRHLGTASIFVDTTAAIAAALSGARCRSHVAPPRPFLKSTPRAAPAPTAAPRSAPGGRSASRSSRCSRARRRPEPRSAARPP